MHQRAHQQPAPASSTNVRRPPRRSTFRAHPDPPATDESRWQWSCAGPRAASHRRQRPNSRRSRLRHRGQTTAPAIEPEAANGDHLVGQHSLHRREQRERQTTRQRLRPAPQRGFSTHSWRRILAREAPSAIRVAISGVRRWMRASISPARFAQAISRMNPTAAIRAWVCERMALPA